MPVKARIWKDRDCDAWHFDVRGGPLRCTGERPKWQEALSAALAEMDYFAAFDAFGSGHATRGRP